MLGAAHKPGALPLRPLGLGDMYDGAFRIIRFNPKATVGAALLVSVVTMTIPIALVALLTFTVGLDAGPDVFDDPSAETDPAALLAAYGPLAGGFLLLQVGLVLVTGMVAHVTAAAAVGRRITLGEAWAATRGRRWRLLGLVLLVGLVSILLVGLWALVVTAVVFATGGDVLGVLLAVLLSLLVLVPVLVLAWVRGYHLAASALMLEDVGVVGACRRAWALTHRQFWRVFGIALLTAVVGGVVGQVVALPVALLGGIAQVALPEYYALAVVATNGLTVILSQAFVTPFTSAVATVQYLDQRIRKEGYDVELMAQAGILER